MKVTRLDGTIATVTDLKAGIEQAKMYVKMHETAKEQQNEEGVIYYADAHASWEHDLKELLKLQNKVDTIQKSIEEGENLETIQVQFCEWDTPKQQTHCNYQTIEGTPVFLRYFSPPKAGDKSSIFWGIRD